MLKRMYVNGVNGRCDANDDDVMTAMTTQRKMHALCSNNVTLW